MERGRDFRDMVQRIEALSTSYPNIKPGQCTVSTLTITGQLGNSDDVMHCGPGLMAALSRAIQDDTCGFTKGSRKEFLNQMTFKADRVSIKLFSNGSVQLTGCRSVMHFVDVITRVADFIKAHAQDVTPRLLDFNIQLINANMTLNTTVPLVMVKHHLTGEGRTVSYDPDKYPGLNIKFQANSGKRVTVLCFKTGNCIITGAQHPADIVDAYDLMCTTMNHLVVTAPPKKVIHKKPKTRASTAPFRIIDGYEFGDYMLTTG